MGYPKQDNTVSLPRPMFRYLDTGTIGVTINPEGKGGTTSPSTRGTASSLSSSSGNHVIIIIRGVIIVIIIIRETRCHHGGGPTNRPSKGESIHRVPGRHGSIHQIDTYLTSGVGSFLQRSFPTPALFGLGACA
jgi:DsbC/DsbD-like thiol-disulfide interchange protein